MRAVIYCRVSTVEQTQNFSLHTQEKQCRDYCDREGLEVAAVFVERGESAKTTDRTEFLKLLEFCRKNKGKVQALVVYALNRFSRNTADHHAIRTLLAGSGIRLRSVTETIDESPNGRFMESVIAAMAQFDNDVRAERTIAGMKEAIGQGRWVWAAPLGYQRNRAPGSVSLIPDDSTASIVRQAFDLYAAGVGRRDLLRTLEATGLRTRSGKPLTAQSLHNVLKNPIYVGRIRATAWSIERPGDFEPLVSDDLFNRVQRRLRGKDVAPEPRLRNHPEFPLRRFVKCGHCHTPMTGSRSRGRSRSYAYYHCRKGCAGASVPKGVLEQQFVTLLEALQPRPEYLRLFRAIVLDTWQSERRRAGDVRAVLEQRISELRARIERVESAFLYDRSIDRRTYEGQLAKLREDLTLAEMERNAAQLEQLDIDGVLAFASHVLSNSAALWNAAGPDERASLQSALLPRGVEWTTDGFGTVVTSAAFSYLRGMDSEKSSLASPPGFEPGF